MWQSLKRWWKYLAVKLRVVHEEETATSGFSPIDASASA